MNKIYAIKKNSKGEAVVVSEVSEGIRKRVTSRISLSILLVSMFGVLYSAESTASRAVYDIPYQTYRDFSENKGLFKPGAMDIPLYDKSGKVVATLDKAPMIDFSSNARTGFATLAFPQYIVSVKHNTGYKNVRFGYGDDTNYTLVSRNNYQGVRLSFASAEQNRN